jgi:surface antigen
MASGGLLAAKTTRDLPETTPHTAGRLLEGPYVVLLTTDDRARAQRAAVVSFESTPSGQTTIWRNPGNGHWGTLTPSRTFRDATGRYCRDYRQTVTIGGQEHQGNGSACREPDGIWRIMG